MSLPIRNLVLISALILVSTTGEGINVALAAPRGGGRFAIDRPGPEAMLERSQEMFKKMCEFLELDETQKARAKELFESRREEMQAFLKEVRAEELDREQARDKMRQSFEDHRQEFESILTEDQLAKLKKWEEQRGERPGRRWGLEGRPGPLDLELSDSQREQLDRLRSEHREKISAIRDKIENEALEREKASELLKAERDRFRDSLAGVLSEEQMKQLGEMRNRRPGRGPGHGMGPRNFGAPGGPGFGPGPHRFDGPGPEMMPGGRPEFGPIGGVLPGLRHRLNLSEEQVEQFHKLAGAAMEDLFDKFSATLDLEQQEKLKEMRTRFKEFREKQRDGHPGEE